MLSNGKLKFDFVIANINSPDLQGFKLLQLAVSMDIPIICKLDFSNVDNFISIFHQIMYVSLSSWDNISSYNSDVCR